MGLGLNMRVRAGGIIIKNNSILLTEHYIEPIGVHYLLPSGGVEPGETIIDAVKREVKEETNLTVEVGKLAIMYEYSPHFDKEKRDLPPAVSLIFQCKIKEEEKWFLSEKLDETQIGIKWVPIEKLMEIKMCPCLNSHILDYLKNRNKTIFIEEHKLD